MLMAVGNCFITEGDCFDLALTYIGVLSGFFVLLTLVLYGTNDYHLIL